MDEIKKKRGLHPVWFFILLSVSTVILSFIFSLINLQGIQYQVNQNGAVTTTILTVKSLLTLSGLKFILGDGGGDFCPDWNSVSETLLLLYHKTERVDL